VPVEYFGDEGYDSRIVGSDSPFWTRFFFGSIAAAIVVGAVLSWQSRTG
jgi:nucleotide-binding universal stress UspA family protein